MLRHKPPPYGASYRSNSADGGSNFRDVNPKVSSRGYQNTTTKEDPNARGRIRSRSGPYYRAYPTADGTKIEYSHDDEKALQEIDKDITRIWRELQELDGMAPSRTEQVASATQIPQPNKDRGRHVSESKNNNSINPQRSQETKPKYETVTVREFTMPVPVSASPTRIRSTSSSSPHTQSSLTANDTKPKQPEISKTDGKQRTIWDMDCSEPLDPNHTPNYSTPSRRSRDTRQRSGLMKPEWHRRSLSGSRNPYEELSNKNDMSRMSTSLVNDTPIQSQAFATPFGTNITPTPIRRPQQSTRQSPSPRRPLSSSYIPSP